jgi:hypothetical protein
VHACCCCRGESVRLQLVVRVSASVIKFGRGHLSAAENSKTLRENRWVFVFNCTVESQWFVSELENDAIGQFRVWCVSKFYSTSNAQRRISADIKFFYRGLCGARCRYPGGNAKIMYMSFLTLTDFFENGILVIWSQETGSKNIFYLICQWHSFRQNIIIILNLESSGATRTHLKMQF